MDQATITAGYLDPGFEHVNYYNVVVFYALVGVTHR